MSLLLSGTKLAEKLKTELTQRVREQHFSDEYVAILYLGDNPASDTYTRMKQRFAHDIGLPLKIIGQHNEINNYDELVDVMVELAYDDNCIGLMPQLPLPAEYRDHTMEIFDMIPPYKDIDGLSGGFLGQYITQQIDFLGATPQAVFGLLDNYNYGELRGKTVTVVGQSNLLGKPLALGVLRRGGTLFSFNSDSDDTVIKSSCLQSDIIISATGVVHRLDETYFRDDKTQVVIDVGWGKLNGKAVGDVTLDRIVDKVAAFTPIPGGVGPLTIANLLMNVKRLYNKYN